MSAPKAESIEKTEFKFSKKSSKPIEIETQTIELIPGKLGISVNWHSCKVTAINKNAQKCFRKIEEGWKIISIDGEPIKQEVLKKKSKGRKKYKLQCEGIRTKKYVTIDFMYVFLLILGRHLIYSGHCGE